MSRFESFKIAWASNVQLRLLAFAGTVDGRLGVQSQVQLCCSSAGPQKLLLDEFGLQPVVRARQVKTEQLTRHFAHDWFDIAVSTYAIDHTMNPLVAIEQTVAVVKPGQERTRAQLLWESK